MESLLAAVRVSVIPTESWVFLLRPVQFWLVPVFMLASHPSVERRWSPPLPPSRLLTSAGYNPLGLAEEEAMRAFCADELDLTWR